MYSNRWAGRNRTDGLIGKGQKGKKVWDVRASLGGTDRLVGLGQISWWRWDRLAGIAVELMG